MMGVEHTLYRRESGEAYQYTTPERAWKDVEKLARKDVAAAVIWVPMPLRPWRVVLT